MNEIYDNNGNLVTNEQLWLDLFCESNDTQAGV